MQKMTNKITAMLQAKRQHYTSSTIVMIALTSNISEML